MANRYWVGGTGNWSDATNHWSNSSGGSPNASYLPTAADDVYFDSGSASDNYTCTINDNSYCNNFTANKPTGTSKKATFSGTSGKNLYVSGNWDLAGGTTELAMSSFSCQLHMVGSSGTKTINFNGLTIGVMVFNGNATFQLASNVGNFSSILFSNVGGFDANGKTITATGSGLTLTNSTGSDITFYDFSMTTTAAAHRRCTVSGNFIITHTLILKGSNTSTSRCSVFGPNGGQAKITITGTTGNDIQNIDFYNIWLYDAAGDVDLSAVSSADVGGNDGIIFTSAVSRYLVAAGDYSSTAIWSASSGGASGATCPLAQDTVYLEGSNNLTISLNYTAFGDLFCDGSGGGDAFTGTINATASSYFYSMGSVVLNSGMTISGTTVWAFLGRGSHTITSDGVVFTMMLRFYNSGTYSLLDDLDMGSARLDVGYGMTFDANDHNVSAGYLQTGSSSGAVIYMGNGTWTMNSSSGSSSYYGWYFSGVVYGEGSTLKFTDTSNNIVYFYSGSASSVYNIVWFNRGASTGINKVFVNNGTITLLRDNDGLSAHTVQLLATYNLNVVAFDINGSAGNVITIDSSTATNATLTKIGGGVVSCDYVSVANMTCSPARTWYFGPHSTDGGGGNIYAYFTYPPDFLFFLFNKGL